MDNLTKRVLDLESGFVAVEEMINHKNQNSKVLAMIEMIQPFVNKTIALKEFKEKTVIHQVKIAKDISELQKDLSSIWEVIKSVQVFYGKSNDIGNDNNDNNVDNNRSNSNNNDNSNNSDNSDISDNIRNNNGDDNSNNSINTL